MKLAAVLKTLYNQPEEWDSAIVIYLLGMRNAPRGAAYIARWLARKQNFIALNTLDYSLAHIKGLCAMPFLGQSQTYALWNIPELEKREQQELLNFIAEYQGPHRLICEYEGVLPRKRPGAYQIFIENFINKETFYYLSSLITGFKETALSTAFITQLFSYHQSITLDQACSIALYHHIVGKNQDTFWNEWLERIAPHEQSLFTLSQYFFAKDSHHFLFLWNSLHTHYAEEFWTAFWSEQLWQAVLFIDAAKTTTPMEAKKKVSRLPFSFMQRDWTHYTKDELCAAHLFLYENDYKSKQGIASPLGIDLFCLKFIHNYFKKRSP